MKKIYLILLAGLTLCASSCDKLLDQTEGDLTKMTAQDMVSSEAGIKGLLANLYTYLPMNAFGETDRNTFYANRSRHEQSYGVTVSGFWNYSAIREINKFIEALDEACEKGVLSEQARDHYKGEAMFIRAYCYFAAVRVYGGIPIVDHSLDGEYDGGENAGLYIDRSTEKDSWDWVLSQLTEAASLMPETPGSTMRASKYTALALKARVALWAASVSKYWNNVALSSSYAAVQKKLTYMEASYANGYYKQCIDAAAEVIASGKYALYGANPADPTAAAANLQEMFVSYKPTEGLLGKSYVDGTLSTDNAVEAWAPHPVNNLASTKHAELGITLNLVDEFDNYTASFGRADGKVKTKISGDESGYIDTPEQFFTYAQSADYVHYDTPDEPFKDKDARFQAWIVYPNSTFRGKKMPIQAGYIDKAQNVVIYPIENNVIEDGENTYYAFGGPGMDVCSFYLNNINVGISQFTDYSFLLKKYLDPVESKRYTQTPWYDIRYAEVLLSYAEAVVESGQGDIALAKKCLNDVRHRAGFKDDIDLTLDNVLHEFKVEFVYENQMQYVLTRRRAHYNPDNASVTPLEGNSPKKLTLLPLLDLSGATPKYIFLRAASWKNDAKQYSGRIQANAEDYYQPIPNYQNNRIDDNNK